MPSEMQSNQEISFYDWAKKKFPILVILTLFAIFVLILGIFSPKFASCCGEFCPVINSNEKLCMSISAYHDIVTSIPLSILSILSIFALIPALYYGQKRFLKLQIFDWAVIFMLCIYLFRGIILLNMIQGFRIGDCI